MFKYNYFIFLLVNVFLTIFVDQSIASTLSKSECEPLSVDNKATIDVSGIGATDYGHQLYNNSRMKKPLTIRYTAYVNDNSDCTIRFTAQQLKENFKLVRHRENMTTEEIPNNILTEIDGYKITNKPYEEDSFISGYQLPFLGKNNSVHNFDESNTLFLSVEENISGTLNLCVFPEGPLVEDSPFLKYNDCTNRPISQESQLEIISPNYKKSDIFVDTAPESLQCDSQTSCKEFYTNYDDSHTVNANDVPDTVKRTSFSFSFDGIASPPATKLRLFAHSDWKFNDILDMNDRFFEPGVKLATLCLEKDYENDNYYCNPDSWHYYSMSVLALYNGKSVTDSNTEINIVQEYNLNDSDSAGTFKFVLDDNESVPDNSSSYVPNNGFSLVLFSIMGYQNRLVESIDVFDSFRNYTIDCVECSAVVSRLVQDNYGNLELLSLKVGSTGEGENQKIDLLSYDITSCDNYEFKIDEQESYPYCDFLTDLFSDNWWKVVVP
ncbi:hypothetical protein [Zooshikella sp. RANM57]|uniref:hypothetical protein n=1 Tax=Zooshikella sp. RANM57 TaxID=3425863 RepID=UPI003D6DFC38